MYNLFLGLTSECNYQCRPCHHYCAENNDKIDVINIGLLNRFFNAFGFPIVAYIAGGGEPTLSDIYKPIVDLLALNKVAIITITNGSQLHKLDEGFLTRHNFIISLPSFDEEIYSDYTGCCSQDALFIIKNNIGKLNKNTILQVTLTKQNVFDKNIIELFEYCDDYGIEYISFQIASHSMNGDGECYLTLNEGDFLCAITQISKHYNVNLLGVSDKTPDYHKLFASHENFNANSIVIQEDGEIYCCCSPDAKNIGSLSEVYQFHTISQLKMNSLVCGRCSIL